MLTTAEEFITQAKVKMRFVFPFFGYISMSLMTKENNRIPTMAVNLRNELLFNRAFVMSLSPEDLLAAVCHETMHIVQMALSRIPEGGIPEIWNLAADQIINTMIYDAGIPFDTFFNSICTEELREITRNKTTEVRYYELLKETENTNCPACGEMIRTQGQGEEDDKETETKDGDGSSDGCSGGSDPGNCSNHSHGQKDGSSSGEVKHTCKNPFRCSSGSMVSKPTNEQVADAIQKVVGAYQAAKAKEAASGRGNLPGSLEAMILDLLKPSINWKEILSRTAKKVFRGGMDWRRQSKRMIASGVRYPGRKPEMKGAVVAIDTSGSIGTEDLTRFMSEAKGILQSAGCKYMIVFFHDILAYHVEEYSSNTMNKIKIQRGGTSHVDFFSKIKELKDQPSLVICFTDLYTEFPTEIPKVPVIWAHIGDCEIPVPFGTKLEIKLGK